MGTVENASKRSCKRADRFVFVDNEKVLSTFENAVVWTGPEQTTESESNIVGIIFSIKKCFLMKEGQFFTKE